MKKVFYNTETGEVTENFKDFLRAVWVNWKFYHLSPFEWKMVRLVK